MCPMDGLRQLEVSIDSMIVCASIFSCLFSVRMYYCIELSAGFDWFCASQVFIIIIIINTLSQYTGT